MYPLICVPRTLYITSDIFTITAEIHARSLVNFYCQYAHRHMNLKFMRRVSERERERANSTRALIRRAVKRAGPNAVDWGLLKRGDSTYLHSNFVLLRNSTKLPSM